MSYGTCCIQPRQGKVLSANDCAWPARFVESLQSRFPRSTIDLQNRAIRGGSAGEHLALLGVTLASMDYKVDLVVLDLTSNHADPKQSEQLVRALRTHVPDAVVYGLLTWPDNLYQSELFEHYDVPMLDLHPSNYRSMLHKTSTHPIWHPPGIRHPVWQTHQALADMMAGVWDNSRRSGWAPVDRNKELPEAMNIFASNFAFCADPLVHLAANSTSGDLLAPQSTDPRKTLKSWRLYEDVAGKPGWIATAKGSKIRFPLRLGRSNPTIGIIYLKSYEGLGQARIALKDTTAPGVQSELQESVLNGLWNRKSSETELHIVPVPAALAKADVLELELADGPKFKVTAVLSC